MKFMGLNFEYEINNDILKINEGLENICKSYILIEARHTNNYSLTSFHNEYRNFMNSRGPIDLIFMDIRQNPLRINKFKYSAKLTTNKLDYIFKCYILESEAISDFNDYFNEMEMF
jgi:hypothetical protein